MALKCQYNQKSPGVKRLMREACELSDPTDEYHASPLEDNLFEWHFTVRGPPGTEFEGGFYHGRILLPTQYPMQPPNIILLTPNGRFETNKKICLSISGHHPESWQPSWSIRTALLALIAFMPTPPGGTIGSLDYTPEERKKLAQKSQNWECPICGKISSLLSSVSTNTTATPLTKEETDLISQIALKSEEESLKQNNQTSVEQNESSVRHRLTGTGEITEPVIEQLEADPNCPNEFERDIILTCAAVTIVVIIAMLITRRLFFI